VSQRTLYPLATIGLLFFVFGFLTWVNGILIPYFQICMELSNLEATLVAFAAYAAYFVMALPAAYALKRTGYKQGMVIGLLVMSVGTLLFVPAAYTRLYPLFLAGLFITATGLALIQTAANPYIAIIGPVEGTAQRIGIMGICNKVAGILCLIVLGNVFFADADNLVTAIAGMEGQEKATALDAYALRIVKPYLIITAALIMVAGLVQLTHLPEIDDADNGSKVVPTVTARRSSALHYPYLILGVLALFFGSACEVIPIDGIILYSRALGIPLEVARHFSTYTLYVMVAGYLAVSILVPKYVSQRRMLQFAAGWGLLFTICCYFSTGMITIYCLLSLGFSASMLWGTIWGLSIRGLGVHTKQGAAFLIMAIIGGGIFPLIFGHLLDLNPLYPQTAILLLLPLYAYLLYFALHGYRIEHWCDPSVTDLTTNSANLPS
jgi:glucose/galactose transporter